MKKAGLLIRESFALGVLAVSLLALAPSAALADELYRCYNPSTGEHLYTTHKEEVEYLQTDGWSWETDQTMNVPTSSSMPVWRLVNNGNDYDHHYTSDAYEAEVLTTQRGWEYDFNGEPAFYSAGSDQFPVYRIYDTRAARFGHLFTKDAYEKSVWLGTGSWNDEGIAWYALGNETRKNLKITDTAYTVDEYGHVHYIVQVKNPNKYHEATYATVTATGFNRDGSIAFSGESYCGPLMPGDSAYVCGSDYSEGFSKGGTVKFSVAVSSYNWRSTAAKLPSNLYELSNVSIRRTGDSQYAYLQATGVIKHARSVDKQDVGSDTDSPSIVCVLKDSRGKLVGGFDGYVSNELAVGASAAFDFSDSGAWRNTRYASVQLYVCP